MKLGHLIGSVHTKSFTSNGFLYLSSHSFFLTDGPLLRKAVKKKMKTVVRPFTPVHNSLLVPNTSEAAMYVLEKFIIHPIWKWSFK